MMHEPATTYAVTYGGMFSESKANSSSCYGDKHLPSNLWISDSGAYRQFCVIDGLSGYFSNGDIAVWIKGYASVNGGEPSHCAEYIYSYYREQKDLPIDLLEGSYVIAIHDRPRARILMYRNLAGAVDLYYSVAGGEFRYATNLAHLLKWSRHKIQVCEKLLPVFFLYRCLPGRETIFKGVMRLMPGDTLVCDSSVVQLNRTRTFNDLRGSIKVERDVVGQLDETIGNAVKDCVRTAHKSAILLSGGVDSTLLQCHWNRVVDTNAPKLSFCATVNHPDTSGEFSYAQSSAHYLNARLINVPANDFYLDYLDQVIADTGETPNHVQSVYFQIVAEAMQNHGITTGISGEAADGLFGVATQLELQIAQLLRSYCPSTPLRRLLMLLCFGRKGRRWAKRLDLSNQLDNKHYLEHPINQQASFAHLDSVIQCFGLKAVCEAMEYRRDLIAANGFAGGYVEQLHAANLLTSSINSAAFWNTLFNSRGGQLLSPFLDSRVVRLAMCIDDPTKYQFRKPKQLLKEALARHTTHALAFRRKLSFGQPIFEWMAASGQLRSAVDQIGNYAFVAPKTLSDAKANPNWFLYNLLCFDRLMRFVRVR